MIKRIIILTTAAVCLAASLLLIITFSMRFAAEPAFIGDKFGGAQAAVSVREPSCEHMRERMREYERYIAKLKPQNDRTQRPSRPEKPICSLS